MLATTSLLGLKPLVSFVEQRIPCTISIGCVMPSGPKKITIKLDDHWRDDCEGKTVAHAADAKIQENSKDVVMKDADTVPQTAEEVRAVALKEMQEKAIAESLGPSQAPPKASSSAMRPRGSSRSSSTSSSSKSSSRAGGRSRRRGPSRRSARSPPPGVFSEGYAPAPRQRRASPSPQTNCDDNVSYRVKFGQVCDDLT